MFSGEGQDEYWSGEEEEEEKEEKRFNHCKNEQTRRAYRAHERTTWVLLRSVQVAITAATDWRVVRRRVGEGGGEGEGWREGGKEREQEKQTLPGSYTVPGHREQFENNPRRTCRVR